MTNLGLLAVALGVVVALYRPRLMWVLIAGAAALPASAVLLLGGNAITPFYFYVLCTLSTLGVLSRRRRTRRPPALDLLVAFTVLAVIVTAISPAIFSGILVSTSKPGLTSFSPLRYSTSNAAQVLYLVASVTLVIHMSRLRDLPSYLASVAFGTGVVLNTLRYVTHLTGAPFPAQFINNSTVRYIDVDALGRYRLRGVFAEPSELSVFSIGALAFFLSSAVRSRGKTRLAHLALAACSGLDLAVSNSATAAVALILVGLAAAATLTANFLRGARAPLWVLVVSPMVTVLAFAYWRTLASPFLDLIEEKRSSTSYEARSGLDAQGWHVFLDTWGIGAGLGSNRPSSMALTLLSDVGVLGTVLFACFLALVLGSVWRSPKHRPVAWGLIGILIAKVVASPDLSTPVMWLLIAISANVYLLSHRGSADHSVAIEAKRRAMSGSPRGSRPGDRIN